MQATEEIRSREKRNKRNDGSIGSCVRATLMEACVFSPVWFWTAQSCSVCALVASRVHKNVCTLATVAFNVFFKILANLGHHHAARRSGQRNTHYPLLSLMAASGLRRSKIRPNRIDDAGLWTEKLWEHWPRIAISLHQFRNKECGTYV